MWWVLLQGWNPWDQASTIYLLCSVVNYIKSKDKVFMRHILATQEQKEMHYYHLVKTAILKLYMLHKIEMSLLETLLLVMYSRVLLGSN